MGYPDATIMLCATLGAAIGLWQGWLNLRQIWQKTKNDKRNKK
jgi:protein-S-isoprenylcysteine O-methyltransferase Ste14